jgi:hypothetical protein
MKQINELFTWPNEKPNVPPDSHGWFDVGNAAVLSSILNENIKTVVELGSWLGSSTRYILNKAPNANVIAIDHWSNDLKDYGNGGSTDASSDPGIEKIYTLWETFLVNCWDYRNRLYPVRAYTQEGLNILKGFDIKADIVYIDASHSYEDVLADITLSREIWPNAQIIGDDYVWDSVRKAVHEYADKNGFDVFSNQNCWFYKPKVSTYSSFFI